MQKNLAKISVIAAAIITLAGCATKLPAPEGKLSIKALIDGRDLVFIKGNTIWMQHEAYDLPGKWAGHDLPVKINGEQDWKLVWNGNLAQPAIIENFVGIPTSGEWNADNFTVRLANVGYGNSKVVRYPSAQNGYTLVILLDDTEPNGAHWYSVDIDWDEEK